MKFKPRNLHYQVKALPIMTKIIYAAILADTPLTSALQILCTLANSRNKWKHSALVLE